MYKYSSIILFAWRGFDSFVLVRYHAIVREWSFISRVFEESEGLLEVGIQVLLRKIHQGQLQVADHIRLHVIGER